MKNKIYKPEKGDLDSTIREEWWTYEFEELFSKWAKEHDIGIDRENWLPYWEAWKDGYGWGYNA